MEPAEPQRHKEGGARTKHNIDNNKNTTFILNINGNINSPSKKEREVNPCRNVGITAQTSERGAEEAIKTAAPLEKPRNEQETTNISNERSQESEGRRTEGNGVDIFHITEGKIGHCSDGHSSKVPDWKQLSAFARRVEWIP